MRTVDQNEQQTGLGAPIRKESGSPIKSTDDWERIPDRPGYVRSKDGRTVVRTDEPKPWFPASPFYVAQSLEWWMAQRNGRRFGVNALTPKTFGVNALTPKT